MEIVGRQCARLHVSGRLELCKAERREGDLVGPAADRRTPVCYFTAVASASHQPG